MKLLLTGTNTYDHKIVKAKHQQYLSGVISKEDYALYILNCLELYIASLVARFCFDEQEYEDKMSDCRMIILSNIEKFDPEKGVLFSFFKPKFLSVLYKYDGALKKINPSSVNKVRKALQKRGITEYDDPSIMEAIEDIHLETGLSTKTINRILNALNINKFELLDNMDYTKSVSSNLNEDEDDLQIESYKESVEPDLRELFQAYVIERRPKKAIKKKFNLNKKEFERKMAKLRKSLLKIDKLREELELPKLEDTDAPEIVQVSEVVNEAVKMAV